MYLNQIKLKHKLILIEELLHSSAGNSEKSKNSEVNNKVDLDKRIQYRLEK